MSGYTPPPLDLSVCFSLVLVTLEEQKKGFLLSGSGIPPPFSGPTTKQNIFPNIYISQKVVILLLTCILYTSLEVGEFFIFTNQDHWSF